MEVEDILKVQIELDTPNSVPKMYNFGDAIGKLVAGATVAEINPVTMNIIKVYKYEKEFFRVNIHLGTYIKTSDFDLQTNRDIGRRFVVVNLIKKEDEQAPKEEPKEIEHPDKFLQYIAETLRCALENGTITGEDYARSMLFLDQGDIPQVEVKETPMFFECEDGDLISIKDIVGIFPKQKYLCLKRNDFAHVISENSMQRLLKFVAMYGIYGKEM